MKKFVVYVHISSDHDEIWYVGSLAVPEYETDVKLDFEGQEATPKSLAQTLMFLTK